MPVHFAGKNAYSTQPHSPANFVVAGHMPGHFFKVRDHDSEHL